jgi:hypothetical protein
LIPAPTFQRRGTTRRTERSYDSSVIAQHSYTADFLLSGVEKSVIGGRNIVIRDTISVSGPQNPFLLITSAILILFTEFCGNF